jgi:hypothetical protein
MIRNIRNILKLNARICKRFSTNSERETVLSGIKDCKNEKLLLSIKDDLRKNHIEINNIRDDLIGKYTQMNNIRDNLNDTLKLLKMTFLFTCVASFAGAAQIGKTIAQIGKTIAMI